MREKIIWGVCALAVLVLVVLTLNGKLPFIGRFLRRVLLRQTEASERIARIEHARALLQAQRETDLQSALHHKGAANRAARAAAEAKALRRKILEEMQANKEISDAEFARRFNARHGLGRPAEPEPEADPAP